MEDVSATKHFFRPFKRRKVLKQHRRDDVPSSGPLHDSTSNEPDALLQLVSQQGLQDISEDGNKSMMEVVRKNKTIKSRRGGIEFKSSQPAEDQTSREGAPSESVALTKETESASQVASRRFVPPNSRISGGSEDQITAIVESQLARLRGEQVSQNLPSRLSEDLGNHPKEALKPHERQPASLGQIQEIDLGLDSTRSNVVRTEAAQSRLAGNVAGMAQADVRKEVVPGELGKFTNKKSRRGSENLKRDRIVEEVLGENKLDLYDEQNEETSSANEDQAADDRVAEDFRRAFMEAVQSRNYTKKPPQNPKAGKGSKQEQIARGPKLGGSRSARAQMRAQEQKSTAKK